MKKLTKAQKQAARNLVTTYAAYMEAKDNNAKRVWGRLLLEDQEATGIEMLDPQNIKRTIASAEKAA